MTATSTTSIVSFHLIRYARRDAMRFMALDRPVLRGAEGLAFWKLLGTARGRSMSLSADLRRWAMLGVWDGEAALDRFLADSPVARRWREQAVESWHVRMAPLRSHGRWGGVEPFGPPAAGAPDGPVAVLTRATIRPSRLVEFYRSVPAVERDLAAQDGCLASVGMGEWPVARQATFSLWRDAAAVGRFAYGTDAHRRVIARVRARDWYSEELFARLVPLGSAGTWDGADPLARA